MKCILCENNKGQLRYYTDKNTQLRIKVFVCDSCHKKHRVNVSKEIDEYLEQFAKKKLNLRINSVEKVTK